MRNIDIFILGIVSQEKQWRNFDIFILGIVSQEIQRRNIDILILGTVSQEIQRRNIDIFILGKTIKEYWHFDTWKSFPGNTMEDEEPGGSAVECLTRVQAVVGLSLNRGTVVWPMSKILYPMHSTGSTQEDPPSLDWKMLTKQWMDIDIFILGKQWKNIDNLILGTPGTISQGIQ